MLLLLIMVSRRSTDSEPSVRLLCQLMEALYPRRRTTLSWCHSSSLWPSRLPRINRWAWTRGCQREASTKNRIPSTTAPLRTKVRRNPAHQDRPNLASSAAKSWAHRSKPSLYHQQEIAWTIRCRGVRYCQAPTIILHMIVCHQISDASKRPVACQLIPPVDSFSAFLRRMLSSRSMKITSGKIARMRWNVLNHN